LTKYQINQIIKIISQNYLVDSELERVIKRDIKQLMNIGCYRGFRHNAGLPSSINFNNVNVDMTYDFTF
jgi:small subunit ribosomal protein S13